MRAYLDRKLEGVHASLKAHETGRSYSRHSYTDTAGKDRRIYFETTLTAGRENEDFMRFLEEGVPSSLAAD